MAKTSYEKQFKKGTMPIQPVQPHSPLNSPEVGSPGKQRKRDSVKLGSQTEARPGLAGVTDFDRPRRK